MKLGLVRLGSLLGAGLALACNVEPNDPKSDPQHPPPAIGAADFAWDGVHVRTHRDAPSALRFPVPVTGYRVTATHFDPATPPVKMKHELSLSQDRREVLRIEVWNDTEGLGLQAWFDQYLRFMATPDAVVETARAGRNRVDSIVVRQPRSEQALARRSVILALEGRILRVTSIDDADPTCSAIFDRVVDALETDGPS